MSSPLDLPSPPNNTEVFLGKLLVIHVQELIKAGFQTPLRQIPQERTWSSVASHGHETGLGKVIEGGLRLIGVVTAGGQRQPLGHKAEDRGKMTAAE